METSPVPNRRGEQRIDPCLEPFIKRPVARYGKDPDRFHREGTWNKADGWANGIVHSNIRVHGTHWQSSAKVIDRVTQEKKGHSINVSEVTAENRSLDGV
ncbi:hypothetical protein [Streptomyces sp. SP18CS02]|uniref:hypothetical protein n=1 Tax=Streptomyces sp. SP18CS02 TaxID=3002531 RepID=UPI002E775FB7|nr:hypothetical protein [Streptomyces sp. SP18CS02]MEE1751158.1 hypothetical protein [Streptomyces sp. SP18CS02]